jgi:hypothetical protein
MNLDECFEANRKKKMNTFRDVTEQLFHDRLIYGQSIARMVDGKWERIDPTTVRIQNYERPKDRLTLRERIIQKWHSFIRYVKAINPLNWRIAIYRKNPVGNHPESMCKVGYDGKYLFLLGSDSQQLPGQISMTIKDKVNKIPVATVEVMVDLREIIKIEV